MKNKLLIFILLNAFSISGYSEEIAKATKLDNLDKYKTFIITLGYKNGATQINHNETSSASGFNPLNKTSIITNNSFELGSVKEFFSSSNLSFSLHTSAGIRMGKDKSVIIKDNITYSDKLSGNHYSIGGSVNLNVEAYKLKIQPYLFTSIGRIYTKTLLNYSQGTGNPTFIQYRANSQVTDIGAGVRFLDSHVQLMSYFSVNYCISNKIKSSSTMMMNYSTAVMSSTSKVYQQPLTFSLGFGFMF